METPPSLKKVLQEVANWLDIQQIPFMILGGIAASLHGIPRQTFDIDIKFQLKDEMTVEMFVDILKNFCSIVPSDPVAFINEMGVLPVELKGVRIDFILAKLPFEIEAIQRSIIQKVYDVDVPVCTPEDLIVQKAISTRSKDWMDIEAVVETMGEKLNWDYIFEHCREMSRFLNDTSIMDKIERIKNEP